MSKSNKIKTRSWSFIVYPESAPSNWIDILNDMHIEIIISPLHDKDTDPDGEVKKPHYHVMIEFECVKSFEQIKEITDSINQPIPQKVMNPRSLVRYFMHMDNPDKYQYNIAELQVFGGADINEALKPTYTEKSSIMQDIISFVETNDIIELKEIIEYSLHNNIDWFRVLSESCFFVSQYIKSRRHSRHIDDKN